MLVSVDKNAIISDLDGTLFDHSHRIHHIVNLAAKRCHDCGGLNSKSCVTCGDEGWDKFKPDHDAYTQACNLDTPIETNIHMVCAAFEYLQCYGVPSPELWIVTGRRESVRDITERMLREVDVPFTKVIMRPEGERMADHSLKRQWLREGYLPPKNKIWCVFEDRSRVVQMWRNEGLTCYQVSNGDF